MTDLFIEQPLADAIYYKNDDVIKLLEDYGAKPPVFTGVYVIYYCLGVQSLLLLLFLF